MSVNDLAITIAAENQASAEFHRVASDAATMGSSVQNSASGFKTLEANSESAGLSLAKTAMILTTVTSAGSAVISLASSIGVLDSESAKYARTALYLVTTIAALVRLKDYLTGQTIALSVAYKVKAAAAWIATAAQNALNISYGTFLALTGVGIAVIAAAAAAMLSFASSMNAATSSVQSFNSVSADTPFRMRSITRAGESALYRRGVE